MKIDIQQVQVSFSKEELIVLAALGKNLLEDDPYGETSDDIGLDINDVVRIGSNFFEKLEKLARLID